ncbi:MAG: hypothetical protein IIW21_09170, partial [Clostridia bacterium]|nr:hypothetical protein [Clostridia bacterium]
GRFGEEAPSFLSAVIVKKSDKSRSDFDCRNKSRGCKPPLLRSQPTATPTFWGFFGDFYLGVGNGPLLQTGAERAKIALKYRILCGVANDFLVLKRVKAS